MGGGGSAVEVFVYPRNANVLINEEQLCYGKESLENRESHTRSLWDDRRIGEVLE